MRQYLLKTDDIRLFLSDFFQNQRSAVDKIIGSEEMKPLRETAGLMNATEGIGITFHNYHRDDPNDPQCSIDYIILKGDWELKKVEKWTEQKDGVCLSDHYPICAELI